MQARYRPTGSVVTSAPNKDLKERHSIHMIASIVCCQHGRCVDLCHNKALPSAADKSPTWGSNRVTRPSGSGRACERLLSSRIATHAFHETGLVDKQQGIESRSAYRVFGVLDQRIRDEE